MIHFVSLEYNLWKIYGLSTLHIQQIVFFHLLIERYLFLWYLDVPRPPMNFTGYAYGNAYVNLTWVSGFNGGPEQYFLLYTRLGSNLTQVRNISDPGEGKLVNFNHGPLNMDGEYCYVLKSCNRINCSAQTVETKVTIHSQTTTALDESTCFSFLMPSNKVGPL